MARVVITMDGGLIQHIMADQEGIEVMVPPLPVEVLGRYCGSYKGLDHGVFPE